MSQFVASHWVNQNGLRRCDASVPSLVVLNRPTRTPVVRTSLISRSHESNDDLDIVPMFRKIDARSAAA